MLKVVEDESTRYDRLQTLNVGDCFIRYGHLYLKTISYNCANPLNAVRLSDFVLMSIPEEEYVIPIENAVLTYKIERN